MGETGFGRELGGTSIGLVGFGQVGRRVTERAVALGMRVLAHDPFVDDTTVEAAGATPMSLDRLLGEADILSLHARLARVFTIEPGEGVSYSLTWRATRPSTIGLVPIGYADGWRRSLGNAGDVLVGGQRCPIVGRICMDQFLVDVTEVPGVAEGDEAVLIGRQGPAELTAAEVAGRAGTIPWDVFASLQARLPRVYHRGGAVELVA